MIDDGDNAFEEEEAPNAWIDNHASVLRKLLSQLPMVTEIFYRGK